MRFSFIPPLCAIGILSFLSQTLGYSTHQRSRPTHWLELRDNEHNSTETGEAAPPSLIIDTFRDPLHNDLGFWHGPGEDLAIQHEPGLYRLFPIDPDQNFHTQFNPRGCYSLLPWQSQYLHVVFEGTDQFTVSLNEHNYECSPARAPFPGVPDSVQASRYVMRTRLNGSKKVQLSEDTSSVSSTEHDIKRRDLRDSCEDGEDDDDDQSPASSTRSELYIPLNHFNIDHGRVVSISFHGFYTNDSITLRRIEIVPSVPPPSPANNYFEIPEKLPSGQLVLRCSVPNSFAFGIDDGQPQFAREVMKILDEEDVRVTFFVVGAGLRDPTTNFTRFYREMIGKGHQVALHSNTHPK